MNWQTPVALSLVALAAAAFAWRRFRPRRFLAGKDSPCGCSHPATSGSPPPGLIVSGKRGQRPVITLKSS